MGITEETTYKIRDDYGKLPLSFIPNTGQVHEDVQYYMQGQGYGIYFTENEVVYTFIKKAANQLSSIKKFPLHTEIDEESEEANTTKEIYTLSLSFLGANPHPRIEGLSEGTGKVNYFIGNDPTKWVTNLSTYHKVVYKELWPGVDLVFQGETGKIKYEFVVQPEANIQDIRLTYRGSDDLSLDNDGNLQIHTPFGVLLDEKPMSYQLIEGQQITVTSSYVIEQDDRGKKSFRFSIGDDVNSRFPLVIDPTLAYSTYLGGSSFDESFGIAIDSSGATYVTGQTESPDFKTLNPFQGVLKGSINAFVTKLSPAGNTLIYSTYLGGTVFDNGSDIAVDSSGAAYVTGTTRSPDFPTQNPIKGVLTGQEDAFVTKLSPAGNTLVYSTYLGGSSLDEGAGIAVDNSGSAYVTGSTFSSDFPTQNRQQYRGGQ